MLAIIYLFSLPFGSCQVREDGRRKAGKYLDLLLGSRLGILVLTFRVSQSILRAIWQMTLGACALLDYKKSSRHRYSSFFVFFSGFLQYQLMGLVIANRLHISLLMAQSHILDFIFANQNLIMYIYCQICLPKSVTVKHVDQCLVAGKCCPLGCATPSL